MGKINFGFSAVQAGQKSSTVNAEPRLVANSTPGKFVITSPVSKALGIAVGENVMFLNNISEVETAVNTKHEAIVAWANENGVDLDTVQGKEAAVKAFTMWAIAKGVLQYTPKGEPLMGSMRYTKEDKQAFIDANAAEMIKDEATRATLIERVGNPDATDEELIAAINVDDIDSPQYHTSTGSKTATTGSATGVGCQLNFTDTAIWNALKADLGDAKDTKNRNYRVALDEGFEADVNDGQKAVKVMAYPIEFIDDTDPIVRGEK